VSYCSGTNKGSVLSTDMTKEYIFKINPMGKPRMVHSDAWAHRDVVERYWVYKDMLALQARRVKYEIGDMLYIVFYLPMPGSWSQKKRLAMNGKPHQQKPDADNLLKGFMDALLADDAKVYDVRIRKFWGLEGSIRVFC